MYEPSPDQRWLRNLFTRATHRKSRTGPAVKRFRTSCIAQQLEDRRFFDATGLTVDLSGPAQWGAARTQFTALIPASPGTADYSLSLVSGTTLSVAMSPGTTGIPIFEVLNPNGTVVQSVVGAGGQSAVLQNLAINATGNWVLRFYSQGPAGTAPVRIAVGSALEASDSSPSAALDLGSSLVAIGGSHYSVQGRSQLVSGADIDQYTIDLTSKVGQQVDFVLQGLGGADFRATATMQLIGPGGTIVRVGGKAPAGWDGTSFDLAIRDFRVMVPGVYKLRITTTASGDYLFSVADKLPDEGTSTRDKLQTLVNMGESTLGSVNALLNTLTFQKTFTDLSTDELLNVLINETVVQGYKDATALRAALPGLGVDLENLRADGVISALQLAWGGSLLRNDLGQAITAAQAKDKLSTIFATDKTVLLSSLTTERLLEQFQDQFTTSANDQTNELVAYTRRVLAQQLDNVIYSYRVQMMLPDYTYGPLPSGTTAAPLVNQMPEGNRAIFVRDLQYVDGFGDMHIDKYDAAGKQYDYWMLWMDEWEKIVQQRYETFFGQLKAAGGEVDVVFFDFEMKALAFFEIDRNPINPNATPSKGYWETVTADPRWADLKAALIRGGFTDAQLTVDALNRGWSSRDTREAMWNAVMEERYSEYFMKAVVEPVLALYPNARIGNYNEGFRSTNFPYGSFTKMRQSYYTVGAMAGTHQTPVLYAAPSTISTPDGDLVPITENQIEIDYISAQQVYENGEKTPAATVSVTLRRPIVGLSVGNLFAIRNNRGVWIDPQYEGQYQLEWISADGKQLRYTITLNDINVVPGSYNLTSRTNTATAFFQVFSSYSGLVGDVMELRSHAATSTARMLPWISAFGFQEYRSNEHYDHYVEGIFHAALHGADDFLLWKASYLGLDPETDQIVSAALKELDDLIGFENRHTITFEEIHWDDGYILTGMEAGGHRVYRLTPDPSLSFTQLNWNGGVRFQIGNKIVEIAGAHVYTPTDPNSELGVWIVQDAIPNYLKQSAAVLAALIDQPNGTSAVSGTSGDDNITIQMQGNQYRVTVNGQVQTFDPSTTTSLVIDAAEGNDIVTVIGSQGVLPATLTIVGGTGDDLLILTAAGATSGGFDAVTGMLRFQGGAGNDTLQLIDTANVNSNTVFVYPKAIFGNGLQSAVWYNLQDDIESLELDLGQGHDLVGVSGLSTETTINGNGGNEFVTYEPNTPFKLTYNAGAGYDWLSPVCFGDAANSIAIDGQTLKAGTSTVAFTGLDVLDIYTYGGDDTVTIYHDNSIVNLPGIIRYMGGSSTSANENDAFIIVGSTDNDVVSVSDLAAALPGRYQLAQVESLFILGGVGNDYVSNMSSVVTLIDGGKGHDYIIGGQAIDVIFGGEGVDIIFGNDGDDLISAHSNRQGQRFNETGDRVETGSGSNRVVAATTDTVMGSKQLINDASFVVDPLVKKLLSRLGNKYS